MEIKKKYQVLKLWRMTLQVLNLNKRFQGQVLKAAQHQPVGVSNLYPPHFAGTIQQVLAVGETDDEVWENDVADYIEPSGMV